MKVFRLILILMMGILTACGTTDSSLPTQVILPTDNPTETATSTPTLPPSATPNPTPTAQAVSLPSSTNETASVAFLQTIIDFPDVDIYIEGSAYAFAMQYGQSTQPSELAAGTYTLRVLPAGITLRDNTTPLLTQLVTFAPQITTVIALSGTAQAPQFSLYPLTNAPLDGGQSRISLIHLVTNVPNLNIRESGIDVALPVIYGQQTIPANIRAGETTITIQTGETVLVTEVISFRERENVTLIAYGDSVTGVNLARFNNRVTGRTTVRLVNISSAATLIDVYLNDTLFFANADYGRITERQQIVAGDFSVAVYTGGADISRATPLYTTTLIPRQDDSLTLVFMGAETSLRLVTVRDDLSPMPPNQARITFVHAAPDADIIQANYETGPMPFVGRIGYGQATSGTLLNAEMQSLYFFTNLGDDQIPVEVAENLLFEQGISYLYFIIGRELDTPPLILSETLGIDERLETDISTDPTQAPLLPVRVQILNMLNDRSAVDVLIDGAVVTTALPHAQLSPAVIVSTIDTTVSTISARVPNSDIFVAANQYPFQRDFVHTIYVYGDSISTAKIAIRTEQTILEGTTTAFIRLNNFSTNPDVRFNLSVADSSIDASMPPNFTPLPAVQFREEMFASAQPVILDVEGMGLSRNVAVPARLTDLYLIDIERGLVAFKQFDVNLEAGRVYDIVVIQNTGDIQVSMWIIAHPLQTD